MDKDKLIQRLMATFLVELDEHVATLNRDLLALERAAGADRAELVKTLFRTMHSLKGAARSVNVTPIEAACHRLESLLGAARDSANGVGPELIQLLFSAADALAEAGDQLRTGQEVSGGLLALLQKKLDGGRAPAHTPMSAPPPPPGPSESPRPVAPAAAPAREGTIRVRAEKLDGLLAASGELLVARRRMSTQKDDLVVLGELLEQTQAEWRRLEKPVRGLLRHKNGAAGNTLQAVERTGDSLKKLARHVEVLSARMARDQHALEQAAGPLEEGVRRVRMQPFGDACEGLERAVRDLAHAAGKDAALTVLGRDVELDRGILEGLRDPLLHLVRNAVDHGLEPPAVRLQQGKPARGRIAVTAALRGAGVEIVVEDDGKGLDLPQIREQARARRLVVPDDDAEAARLVFVSGLSTARMITELSGRGVGLDVVKHRVEGLHGSIDVAFQPGRGTRLTLTVPLTLTTLRAVLLHCGGQTYALPAPAVRRLLRAGTPDLASVEGREVLLGGAAPVPVVALAGVLGVAAAPPRRAGGKIPLVVVAAGERQVALAVDELVAEQELVVKSLGPRFRRVRNIAGATLLPTGRIALILNAADVVAQALGQPIGAALADGLATKVSERKRRLLIVDDSVTTRSLEKSILEAAGYDVTAAADGAEAWRLLQDFEPDLIVADVEMPRLDGVGLTEAIRASKRLREIPVILITALESQKDMARGLEAGADAYLPKSGFDQRNLLATIAQLL